MSIQLYLGHSGQRLLLDSSVTSLEALKAWITQHAGIQPRSQVLLTAQGKQVRQQTLLTENELFVFDSKLFTGKEPANLPGLDADGALAPYKPGTAPDTISNQNDISAWQNLFRLRRSWASAVTNGCSRLAKQAEQYQDEEAAIARSLGVAVASLQQHIKSGEKKFNSIATWADDVLREQDEHVHGWEHNLDSLRSVPARAEFTRFVQATSQMSRRSSQQSSITTLQGFVDVAKIRKAAGSAKYVTDDLHDRLEGLQGKLENAGTHTDQLLQAVDQIGKQTGSYLETESEATQLMNEVQVVANKIASDFEHVQSLPSSDSKSVTQASKLALLHTRNHLPNLSEYCGEMNELVEQFRERRQQVAISALEHMQTLSGIESELASLYAAIEGFGLADEDQQAFTVVGVIARLPSVYGQLLVESVRRREWVAKMKRDSYTLQEEVATYQEEEEKRRKKWMRSVEDVFNVESLQSSRALGIELNLQNEGGSWPMVTREELAEYLDVLLQVYGEGPVTKEMDLAIKDLDKPTRKQIKHAKAFKNGSMHEAAFGDTSLMLRGDEQYKTLRDMNTRLEEELKGQKSRVRKLEDLLHRSTQSSRANMGDIFTPHSATERHMTPPTAPSGELSRNSSLKHRRLSSTQGVEEKKLARRVVDLEAELHVAKEEAKSRKVSDAEAQKQVEEAVSTKRDLMENMDAQQREFADERRNLETELREARDRVEEVEGEIERLMGSRDDERTGVDSRVAALEEEIIRLKEDSSGHAARAATEHDARSIMECKLDLAEQARASAEEQVQRMHLETEARRETDAEQLERLTTAHVQLLPDEEAPGGIAALGIALAELSRKSAAHAKDLADAVAFAKSDNQSLRSSNEAQKSDLKSAEQRVSAFEDKLRQLSDQLYAERAKTSSAEQQLQDEQEQLRTLRNKFADGETGSEALRQRVEDEEKKVGRLSSELAEARSHVNSLDVELIRLQKKHKAAQVAADASADRLHMRAGRSTELSQRLHSQHARLGRLLERLGLAVSYQDDNMVVERASKIGASTTMLETQSLPPRTTSLTSPPPTRKSSSADEPASDVSLVRWSEGQNAEEEAEQYTAFKAQLSRFDIDVFAEAIVKRLRDFEYTARKYGKEAKESVKRADAYKDRAQKLKSEAYAKIAVKDFKDGDLALFLPTRGQAKGAWAAFNIGCPHYFLAEREGMRLGSRDFIVARISKVEQKIVDLSRSLPQHSADGRSIDEMSEAPSFDDDNPFELSDGLTWWMVHASEERGAGAAPTTPGLGKSTVAAANVDAKGSIRIKRTGSKGDDASKHLNKSLDSRRSSSNSKKGVVATLACGTGGANRSPSIGSNLDGAGVVRPRSESQVSLRPPPGAAAMLSGLGIATSPLASPSDHTHDSTTVQPPASPQIHKSSSNLVPQAPEIRPDMRRELSPNTTMARERSRSPSKSIRSLQRHLDREKSTGSPIKSPVKSPVRASPVKPGQAQGKQVWESLWNAEFSLESPSKKGGGDQ